MNILITIQKIKVICHNTDMLGKEHGIFEITPNDLLRGKGKNYDFSLQKERDERKYNLCCKNNINIIYYTNININKEYFSKLFFTIENLLKYIKYLYKNNENN